MRYDPVVRASICYLEFLRCFCAWERIESGIAALHGAFAWSFIDRGLNQLPLRIYFHIAFNDKWQGRCGGQRVIFLATARPANQGSPVKTTLLPATFVLPP
jgi:hypothetical protein